MIEEIEDMSEELELKLEFTSDVPESTDEFVPYLWENNLDDLLFTLALCVFTCAFGAFLRKSLKDVLGVQGFLLNVLFEGTAAAELAVFSFELNYIVWENYNLWSYMFCLILYSLWLIPDTDVPAVEQTTANPIDLIIGYVRGERSLLAVIIITTVQIASGIASYYLIVLPAWSNSDWLCFWKTSEINSHLIKINSPIWPTSVLTDSPSLSAIAEGFVTFFIFMINTLTSLERGTPNYQTINIMAIIFSSVVASFGAPFSGAFYNPAIATALELTFTSGTHIFVKFLVYWIAPFIGLSAGFYLEPYVLGLK